MSQLFGSCFGQKGSTTYRGTPLSLPRSARAAPGENCQKPKPSSATKTSLRETYRTAFIASHSSSSSHSSVACRSSGPSVFGTTSLVLVLQEINRSACACTHCAGGTETLGAAQNDVKASRGCVSSTEGLTPSRPFSYRHRAPRLHNRQAA